MKNLTNVTNPDARTAWTMNVRTNETKTHFMCHFDAIRAGLVLLQEEVLRGGRSTVRRGGCNVCLQP